VCEPIIRPQALPRFELFLADQWPSRTILPAAKPAERTFAVVQEHRPLDTVDLAEVPRPALMLSAKRLASFSGAPPEPRVAGIAQNQAAIGPLEEVGRQAGRYQVQVQGFGAGAAGIAETAASPLVFLHHRTGGETIQ